MERINRSLIVDGELFVETDSEFNPPIDADGWEVTDESSDQIVLRRVLS